MQLKLKHIPLLLIGLILAFCLLVWTINLSIFDEEPSAGVQQTLKPHEMPQTDENAYFFLFGFEASADKAPHSAGQSLQQRYEKNRDVLGKDELLADDYAEILGGVGKDKVWLESFERCRSRTDDDCFERAIAQLEKLDFESARLSLMLKRYDALVQYRDFAYPHGFTFYSPIPGYATPLALQQITLARSAQYKSTSLFLDTVEKDLAFWRMLLSKGSSLIDKMVAIAAIWNDLKFLSAYFNTTDMNDAEREKVLEILSDLNAEEVDISEAFVFEARSMYHQLENLTADELESFFESSSWFMGQMIQTNATNNSHYELYLKPLLDLSKLTSEEFYIALPEGASKFEEGLKVSLSPGNLYNLGGKVLLQNSGWMASDYIARVHDLSGMFSLVKLQLSLKGFPKEEWPSIIAGSQYKNPYNNHPFEWDLEKAQLGFKCMNEGSSCAIKL